MHTNKSEVLENRKKALEGEFEKIRNEMSGHYVKVNDLIINDAGKYDDERIDGLINKLILSLDEQKKASGESPLKDDYKQWLRAYLYCAITGPVVSESIFDPTHFFIEKSFRFIIDGAKECSCAESEEAESGVLFSLHRAYFALTGKDFSDSEKKKKSEPVDLTEEEIEEEVIKSTSDAWDEDLDRAAMEAYEEKVQSSNASVDQWKEMFAETDRFVEAYQLMRKPEQSVDLTEAGNDIELICDRYLYESGLSPYSFDDEIFDQLLDVLKQTNRKIDFQASRSRMRNVLRKNLG
ncbi:hypothetical protein SAMN02910292_01235 [Lachnospiraceae bacterium XBB2008]|nr:hypothetical protein SAMN02910292_01235 [Lachnospiraceae bacterium XBB2008]